VENLFCSRCGGGLEEQSPSLEEAILEGERKPVTVLFSDLSEYSAMTENLDPEEVKEIMGQVFEEIAGIAAHYEGYIDRFFGDEVLVLFGVPKAHEDDPVRAIRAAMKIRDQVKALSSRFEAVIGQPLSMHTGIETGLVVTGDEYIGKGRHGLTGDAVNLAARLTKMASPGEILVGPGTHRRTEGYFTFEPLELTSIKGKKDPIQPYRVLARKEEPAAVHRPSGLRAELVGREPELARLNESLRDLEDGRGSLIFICGAAGTGKSRLVREFRDSLGTDRVQWREGRSYPHTQNIPYSPLRDIFSRAWHIDEGASKEEIRETVEWNIRRLAGDREDLYPYLGSLYALDYPQLKGLDPEFWKSRLHESVRELLTGLVQQGPTVICLEDLHWADPSSLDLLRFIIFELRYPAIFLCIYRPPFSLFTGHEVAGMGGTFQEIELTDLSPSEARQMLTSLLDAPEPPAELSRFIEEKVEGNPFYIEEVVNTLIESGTLVRLGDQWRLSSPLGEAGIPLTISGIITARIDRLGNESKRIIQEASVIGRTFLLEILVKVTGYRDHLYRSIRELERLDLIRVRSLEPELEYTFKHALTQDVVYNGLLRKERQDIHEKIARVMEDHYRDRLPEFYETLALHYKLGRSLPEAVDYLMKSGEKSLGRYALEESHRHYREAFELLHQKATRTRKEEELLMDILLRWMLVYFYRGDFREMTERLEGHREAAESLGDRARLGMFYMWMGMTLFQRERFGESYDYLQRALNLGEEIGDREVIAYACTWLTYNCAERGCLDEAVEYGGRALEIGKGLDTGEYPYHLALGGLGYTWWMKGNISKVQEMAEELLEYGRTRSNIRSLVFGHWIMGFSYLVDSDFEAVIECNKRAISVSADPWYSQFPRLSLGLGYALNGQYDKAKEPLEVLTTFCERWGGEVIGSPARGLLGAVLVADGQMSKGVGMLEELRQYWLERGSKWKHFNAEFVFGRLYLQIVERAAPMSFSMILRNLGFLLVNVPTAAGKAEKYFLRAIEAAEEIGAKGALGQAWYDLGELHRLKARRVKAREAFSRAADCFEECGAELSLNKARNRLAGLS
jgi:class 3 adenylate cyclase/tetratricopeptide (TPR) repeat protein